MTDKERMLTAREYLSAKRLRDYSIAELERAATVSYPTDEQEAIALGALLVDILHHSTIRRRQNDSPTELHRRAAQSRGRA